MRVALLLVCALAAEVRADGAGVIAASEGERAGVAAAMAEAMVGRAGRIVGDAVGEARAAIAAGAVPVGRLAAFRRVREQIDEGWQMYLRAAFDTAAGKLAAARTEAEPLVVLPGGAELYAEAALKLGAVLDRIPARAEESAAVIGLALALDPDRPITLAEFSPDVMRAFEAVQAQKAPEVGLRVVVRPPEALVQVDRGKPHAAGVSVQVPRGQHLVVARAPGYRPAVRGVAADATSVEIVLEPDAEAARLATGALHDLPEAAAQELVDAALRYADLDEGVLVAETTRRGGPIATALRRAARALQRGRRGRVQRRPPRPARAAARAAWSAARTGELRYPPKSSARTPTASSTSAAAAPASGSCGPASAPSSSAA
ncbi:MAG: hypothetical protein KIT31_22410 [Deltaproteobacteria bacterium]|nr:hypothetical protein [Deltaproteobacteria bacterium]